MVDLPAPIASGRMMKYSLASSGWPGAEQLAGEGRRQHAGARAAGAVQDQHRLAGRLADRRVVQAQLGHHLAGVEAEVAGDPVALLRRRIVGGQRRKREQRQRHDQRGALGNHHGFPPCSLSRSVLSNDPPLLAAHSAPVAAASCITVCSSSQLAPAFARRRSVRLRPDRIVLGQQHAEQNELRGLHVDHTGVERALAELLGDPEEFRVDLAGELELRRRQRWQCAEHLDIAVAEFDEVGGKLLLVAHHSTLIFASGMTLRHFGSSDLMKFIRSWGEPAIDWNR